MASIVQPIPYQLSQEQTLLIQEASKAFKTKPEKIMAEAIEGALLRLKRELATRKLAGKGKMLEAAKVADNPVKARLRKKHIDPA